MKKVRNLKSTCIYKIIELGITFFGKIPTELSDKITSRQQKIDAMTSIELTEKGVKNKNLAKVIICNSKLYNKLGRHESKTSPNNLSIFSWLFSTNNTTDFKLMSGYYLFTLLEAHKGIYMHAKNDREIMQRLSQHQVQLLEDFHTKTLSNVACKQKYR